MGPLCLYINYLHFSVVKLRTRSYAEIVDVLVMLNNDRVLLSEIGKKAQRTIFENYNTNNYIAELNKIYSEA